MGIIINLGDMLTKRKMTITELADKVGTTPATSAILKSDQAKAIRLSTLAAICQALDCQPGDVLEFKFGP